VQCGRIYNHNAVLIRQFIEASQPLNVFRILIHAMQQDHDRIVLLRDGRMTGHTTRPAGPESLLMPRESR